YAFRQAFKTLDKDNPASFETPDSETKTYTWEIPALKYANGDAAKVLAGAKFSLFTDEDCTEMVKFTAKDGNIYRVDPEGTVTEITTPEDGKFVIEGLDAGTYYLKETEAPAGYNKLGTIVKVTIDHEGKITVDKSETATDLVKVNNNSGTELPSTGGTGTTIFYVLGSILVIGAGVLLVTKKRMNDRA
ncbi:MAG: LPXTG cell wall anchor domain-containing protein, partial [Clostridiales bacterium]|nr:LPXTG cell wall anchor domain-containing protein [Clostridiales bacterium]